MKPVPKSRTSVPQKGTSLTVIRKPQQSTKRQHTEWIWKQLGDKGTFIVVGWIHNKARGVITDHVVIRMRSLHNGVYNDIRHNMRVDEAAGLAAGICKVICKQALAGRLDEGCPK